MSSILFVCFALPLWLSQSFAVDNGTEWPEYQLYKQLFVGYDSTVRPRVNPDHRIDVNVSFTLVSISKVNEHEQTITLRGWLVMAWTDDLLRWDPNSFGGVRKITVPSERVWLPDASFLNSVDKFFYESASFRPTIFFNGTIYYTPGGAITLTCQFNLVNYPFDQQTCRMSFSAWSVGTDRLMYHGESFVDELMESEDWQFISKNISSFQSVDSIDEYSGVFFQFTIRRRPLNAILNIILPICMLSFLNLAPFRLPPDSGEKISLVMTLFLAFSVWLLTISSIAPNSSQDPPLIAIYISIFMIISTVSVFVTVFVIHIHHTDAARPIPRWVVKLVNLKRIMRCRRCRRTRKVEATKSSPHADHLTWKKVGSAIDAFTFHILLLFILVTTGAVAIVIAVNTSQPYSQPDSASWF